MNLASVHRAVGLVNPAIRWMLEIVKYCLACTRFFFLAWMVFGCALRLPECARWISRKESIRKVEEPERSMKESDARRLLTAGVVIFLLLEREDLER